MKWPRPLALDLFYIYEVRNLVDHAAMERVKEKQQAEREAEQDLTAGEAAAAKKEGN